MDITGFSLDPPSLDSFESVCKNLKDEFFGIKFQFTGKNKVASVRLKPRFELIASKYFLTYKNRFPNPVIMRICEHGKILAGHIIKSGSRL